MDDIIYPDEEVSEEESPFMKAPIEGIRESHPSGLNASKYVSITFGRFVTLVAEHSFVDVVEKNQDEEVVISTNLLTDLANSRRFAPTARGPLLVLAGVLAGILFGYLFF